jgi:hypothetical protein
VAQVKRDVSRICGFQIGRHTGAVALRERVRHQRVAVTLVLVRRVDIDQRQMPMRLVGVILRHLLEQGGALIALGVRHSALHDLAHLFLVRMNAGRNPQRRAGGGADGASVGKGIAAECPDEARHDSEIVMRVRPGPPRDRIVGKCEHDGVDGGGFIGLADGSDGWMVHWSSSDAACLVLRDAPSLPSPASG